MYIRLRFYVYTSLLLRIYISAFTYIHLAPHIYMSPRVPPVGHGSLTNGMRLSHLWDKPLSIGLN